ncbi:MAG: 2-polyprenylphenol 6-hydroxylase [Zetaproteobacteria bacterium CG_4_9_14_3_um_filter_49_83]|nr:MAG: 2-polyprenylphenol 6-hydroxylase [Zetaproteobacteria bacterium CG1_02_49_23]PIQ34706.1 MAG: 2-polyprenylphenol 6-hydroxylase [Zetaproteobacteria bacterium CG17_big_fil_post_rev_8_21_14_2_50_50_13]PIV29996.1 MAG: 2-polyprenylphenol 6-hydroxylase [Zetaproteobacteria bacterium CG02_land_8_20_14_3_00_50_9]PIY55001.1 MAG: 2-polyprenylphenol 6-hydroxylase [Zetaproteobacteria bacterium CG_4_10_14_0_8_um_filter_49_80]PJA34289.1 MAG: 2-polyprenylphenol 6-hydroxylase [Zetaproteobacteria bacterium
MKLPGNINRNLRLLRIGYILTTHGMAALAVRMRLFRPYAWLIQFFRDDAMPADLGSQIRQALESLGPTFIKFGQMLSTRVDLLPMDVALELKKLQDDVPPESFHSIRHIIERSFKKPLIGEHGIFESFDETPIAAASIAQVHFAELKDGQRVAVKVRRPHVARTIEDDLSILTLLASMFEKYFPEYERLKAVRVVEEFSTTIRGELNLRAEAAHAGRFAENFAKLDGVRVPAVLWNYSNGEVMTSERISGMPIDEIEALQKAGVDTLKLCERAAALFFHMVFVDGYFHADMHPGNIFVSEQGEIILVDFGIVGRLDMHSRRYIGDMLMAFLREDYNRAALVHLDAGYVPLDTDISAFEDALREIAVPIFNRPLAQISIAELLFSMFAVTERFKMETQPQLLLLQKTMVVIEGVARELADQVNIWMLARPLVTEWMARHMGPIGKTEALAGEIRGQLRDWMTLPQKLDRLMTTVTEGRIPSQHLESSRMPQILGSMLAAIGGGILASYATGEVGFWTGISGGSMIFFGLLLAAHR